MVYLVIKPLKLTINKVFQQSKNPNFKSNSHKKGWVYQTNSKSEKVLK